MYSLTIFESPRWWEAQQRFIYDNKTHRRLDLESWEKFVNLFRKLSERPLKGKQDAELISPAVFEDGMPRRNKHVLAWSGWAAVDVDDHVFEGNLEDELRNQFGHWDYIAYSTASSTSDHPKFRLVFRLGRHVQSDEIKHFWYALNSDLNSIGDKQTKDLARMYYIPATYSGANNFFFVNSGDSISVDGLLSKHPYEENKHGKNFLDRLPDAWKEQIINHRKSSLENTSYTWSSYHDCPFVNQRLINDYKDIAHLDGSGRYRMIYKIMCSIASNAVEKGYPMSANEIVNLVKQIDAETSRRYEQRPLEVEANNALEFAYTNTKVI